MKKLMTAGAVLAVLSMAAQASIGIDWQAGGGFYANGTTGANDPGDWVGNAFGSTTAQLMWSADANPDQLISAAPEDIILNTHSPASVYGDFTSRPTTIFEDANFGGVDLSNGFVYARVFEGPAPIPGRYYFATTPFAANEYNPGAPQLQVLDMNANPSPGAAFSGSNELDLLIVPEPSVLAFLGLGGLALALRRNRKG